MLDDLLWLTVPAEIPAATARGITRAALVIALADGAVGVSFGALATAAHLTIVQTVALSALAFTGGSQFALTGVIAAGGAPIAGALSALLLGTRNGLYGLRLAAILPRRMRAASAHLVIDETTGMALAQETPAAARRAFYVTGGCLFTLWLAGTVVGALGGRVVSDPRRFGLDAVGPAVFIALVAPQLRGRRHVVAAAVAVAVTVAATPLVPAGAAILVAAVAVAALAVVWR